MLNFAPFPYIPAVSTLILAVTISGTFDLPDDDAGDTAFAHQAVQTLLGRKPHSVAEVEALSTLIASRTREEVVDALMEEPEFSEYWTTVLADAMKVQRFGDFTQNAECFRQPEYLAAGGDPFELANHIRDAAPSAPFIDGDPAIADTFNGNDAIQAAVAVDDLMVAWRPWLFAVAVKNQNHTATKEERRDNYLLTAFNLRVDCISCHSSTYSTTEVYPDYGPTKNPWDRTSSPGWDLERTAFSNSATGIVNDGSAAAGWYTNGCKTCHGAQGKVAPVFAGGISPKVLTHRVPLLTVEQIAGQILNGGGEMGPQPNFDGDGNNANDAAHATTLAEYLHAQLGGYDDLTEFIKDSQFDHAAVPVAGPWGMNQSATSCNFGWSGQAIAGATSYALAGQTYTAPDMSDVIDAVSAGLAAIPGAAADGEFLARADRDLEPPAEPSMALAMMLVRNIADRLVEEVLGARLTLVHGLSRNDVQSTFLATVVNNMVVNADGRVVVSLKGALRSVIFSPYYNRRAPQYMAPSPDDPSRGAYQNPMAVNPWAATADPAGVPGAPDALGNNANGQGDLVHRRSPDQLLWSVHRELGWPAPYVYPKNTDPYPTSAFMEQIGRYRSDRKPGSTAWQLDTLLFWEAQVGACANPKPTKDDFVDKLVMQPLGGRPVPTVRDLILALKDRLLQEPLFTAGEEPAIKILLDAHFTAALGAGYTSADPLGELASAFTLTDLEGALRKYCGAVLMSPDYLLAGLPTVTTSVAAVPLYTVSLAGEPCAVAGAACSVADYTAHYTCALDGVGCP